MCPECFASIAMLVTGIISTGGVATLTGKLLRKKKAVARMSEVPNPKEKENLK